MRLTVSSYLRLSAPFALSSITTPLLGAVGTAVAGHLGDMNYIGAVALGAVIFSTIYWLFNFLRLITSSYSSQALGRQNRTEINLSILRPGLIAAGVGLAMIPAGPWIFELSMLILSPEKDIRELIRLYFDILIWGAPFVLINFVIVGWLMGQMRFKAVMVLQVSLNLFNCLLCAVLVLSLEMGVAGVAGAGLISQGLGLAAGAALVRKRTRFDWRRELKLIFNKKAFSDLWSTNFYLLIRTACMLVMVNLFMARSAAIGGAALAANAILFQIQYVLGDFFDGLANASSVYSGLAVGRKDEELFRLNLRLSALCGLALAAGLSALWFGGGRFFISLFTNLPEVIAAAADYSIYITLFPLISALGIVYYGIFNGALKTRLVCWSMLLTLGLYLTADHILVPGLGNHGLWLSFIAFYVGRSGFLLLFVPSLLKKIGFAPLRPLRK